MSEAWRLVNNAVDQCVKNVWRGEEIANEAQENLDQLKKQR